MRQPARQARVVKQARVEGGHTHHDARVRQSARSTWSGSNPGRKIIAPPVRSDRLEATKRPWVWKIGRAWSSTSCRREAPEFGQGFGVRQQVAVGQHRPLRPPRGARRVKQSGKVVRPAIRRGDSFALPDRRTGQAAGAVCVEGQYRGPVTGGNGAQRCFTRAITDKDPGRGVTKEIRPPPRQCRRYSAAGRQPRVRRQRRKRQAPRAFSAPGLRSGLPARPRGSEGHWPDGRQGGGTHRPKATGGQSASSNGV